MTDTDWQQTITSGWFIILGSILVLSVFIVLVRYIARSSASRAQARERLQREAEEQAPKCACGVYALQPMPFVDWPRTGLFAWLRDLHGAPPKYHRQVDNMHPPRVCAAHGRVADAHVNGWIANVRARYTTLNATIAAEAAKLHEDIEKSIADSLTQAQKTASKRPAAMITRITARTGTEGES